MNLRDFPQTHTQTHTQMKKNTASTPVNTTRSVIQEDTAQWFSLPKNTKLNIIDLQTKEIKEVTAVSIAFALTTIIGARAQELQAGGDSHSEVVNAYVYIEESDLPVAVYGAGIPLVENSLTGKQEIDHTREIWYSLVSRLSPQVPTFQNLRNQGCQEQLEALIDEIRSKGLEYDENGKAKKNENYYADPRYLDLVNTILATSVQNEGVRALFAQSLQTTLSKLNKKVTQVEVKPSASGMKVASPVQATSEEDSNLTASLQ